MGYEKCESNCRQPPPEELLQGIEEFNGGEWFACHETLEELWIGEPGLVRDLYQGILQMAVGLHHWREGNYAGAVLLMRKGVGLLRHMEPVCQQVDVARLIEDGERVREALERLGPELMGELDQGMIPRIIMIGGNSEG